MLSMSCPRARLMVLRYSRSCAPVCYRSQGAAARIKPTFLAWQAQHLMQANQANTLLGIVHARLAATKAEAPQSDTSPKAKKQGKVNPKPRTPPSPTPVTPAADDTVKAKPSGGSETESKKSKKRKSKAVSGEEAPPSSAAAAILLPPPASSATASVQTIPPTVSAAPATAGKKNKPNALKPGEESQKKKEKKTTASASGAPTGTPSGLATKSIPGTAGKPNEPNTSSKSGGESQGKKKKTTASASASATPTGTPSGLATKSIPDTAGKAKKSNSSKSGGESQKKQKKKSKSSAPDPRPPPPSEFDPGRLVELENFFKKFVPGFVYQRKDHPSSEYARLIESLKTRFEALKLPGGRSSDVYDQSGLERFFEEFSPEFTYRPRKPPFEEYKRLERNLKGHFSQALLSWFNLAFGKDPNNLASWQKICWVLRINPLPPTVEECRKVVMSTHINIVDLLDSIDTNEDIKRFKREEDLAKYTRMTERYFPKYEAKENGLLNVLLRHIDSPIPEKGSRYYRR